MKDEIKELEEAIDRLDYIEKKMRKLVSYRNFLEEEANKKPDTDLSTTLKYFVKALDEILN